VPGDLPTTSFFISVLCVVNCGLQEVFCFNATQEFAHYNAETELWRRVRGAVLQASRIDPTCS
jgi:hypothetical protein